MRVFKQQSNMIKVVLWVIFSGEIFKGTMHVKTIGRAVAETIYRAVAIFQGNIKTCLS